MSTALHDEPDNVARNKTTRIPRAHDDVSSASRPNLGRKHAPARSRTAAPTAGVQPDLVTAAAESLESTLGTPSSLAALVACAGVVVWAQSAPQTLIAAVGVAVPVAVWWRWRAPETWHRWIRGPLQAGVLRLLVYGPRWPHWARHAGVVAYTDGCAAPAVPRLLRVLPDRRGEIVHVRMMPSQTVQDYQPLAAVLAAARGAACCTTQAVGAGHLVVRLRWSPTIAAPSQPASPPRPAQCTDLHRGQPRRDRGHEPRLRHAACTGDPVLPALATQQAHTRTSRTNTMNPPRTPLVHDTAFVRPLLDIPVQAGEGAMALLFGLLGVLAGPLLVHRLDATEGVRLTWRQAVGLTVASTAVSAWVGWQFRHDAALPAWWWLATTSLGLAVIDSARHRLPQSWVGALASGGLAVFTGIASALAQWAALLRAITAVLVVFAVGMALRRWVSGHLGGGDCRLAAALSLYAGWVGWPAVFLGFLAAMVLLGMHAGWVWIRTRDATRRIAAGPGLLIGAWIGIVFGPFFLGGIANI